MAAMSREDFLKDAAIFDVARKRAQQQSASNLQTRRDALTRRFAALGNLDSGARLKLEQRVADEEAQNLNAANESIDAQQQAEMARRREILQGQEFQSGESAKGRSFAAEQAAMQRAFATSERLGGQDFARGERLGGQEFARGERLGGQDFARGERLGGQEFQAGENRLSRDLQESQFGRGLAEQQAARAQQGQQFGLSLAEQQAARKQQGKQFDQSLSADIAARRAQERLAKDQMKQQNAQFEKTYGMSVDQFKESIRQFEETFKEEVRVNQANLDLANKVANEKGFLEKLGSNFSMSGGTKQKLQSGANIVGAMIGGPAGYLSAKVGGKKLFG